MGNYSKYWGLGIIVFLSLIYFPLALSEIDPGYANKYISTDNTFNHYSVSDWVMRTNLSTVNVSLRGEDAGDLSGWSVAGVGDVNNDGFEDCIVGARGGPAGLKDYGEIYVIFGRPTNKWPKEIDLSQANASFIEEKTGDSAGWSVAGAGDVNADGYADLLVGAPFNADGGFNAGKAYLILGRPTIDWSLKVNLSSVEGSFVGEVASDWAGYSVAGVGDANNDGYDDFLISAYANDYGGEATGQTYLFFGRPTNRWVRDMSLSLANASFFGEKSYDQSGWSVTGAGDVNNDGYSDMLVGAPKNVFGGNVAGQAYLILGRTTTAWTMHLNLSDADASFVGEEAGDHAGYSMAGVEDVNNDGYSDFVISAVSNNGGGYDSGQVYLILGRNLKWKKRVSLSTSNASFVGESGSDAAGFSVAGAGDVNNDSFDDFVIGAAYSGYGGTLAGQVYLILGRLTPAWALQVDLSAVNASFVGEFPDDRAGYSVNSAGDVNKDGASDILVGAPYNDEVKGDAGKVYLIFGKLCKTCNASTPNSTGSTSGNESTTTTQTSKNTTADQSTSTTTIPALSPSWTYLIFLFVVPSLIFVKRRS